MQLAVASEAMEVLSCAYVPVTAPFGQCDFDVARVLPSRFYTLNMTDTQEMVSFLSIQQLETMVLLPMLLS